MFLAIYLVNMFLATYKKGFLTLGYIDTSYCIHLASQFHNAAKPKIGALQACNIT